MPAKIKQPIYKDAWNAAQNFSSDEGNAKIIYDYLNFLNSSQRENKLVLKVIDYFCHTIQNVLPEEQADAKEFVAMNLLAIKLRFKETRASAFVELGNKTNPSHEDYKAGYFHLHFTALKKAVYEGEIAENAYYSKEDIKLRIAELNKRIAAEENEKVKNNLRRDLLLVQTIDLKDYFNEGTLEEKSGFENLNQKLNSLLDFPATADALSDLQNQEVKKLCFDYQPKSLRIAGIYNDEDIKNITQNLESDQEAAKVNPSQELVQILRAAFLVSHLQGSDAKTADAALKTGSEFGYKLCKYYAENVDEKIDYYLKALQICQNNCFENKEKEITDLIRKSVAIIDRSKLEGPQKERLIALGFMQEEIPVFDLDALVSDVGVGEELEERKKSGENPKGFSTVLAFPTLAPPATVKKTEPQERKIAAEDITGYEVIELAYDFPEVEKSLTAKKSIKEVIAAALIDLSRNCNNADNFFNLANLITRYRDSENSKLAIKAKNKIYKFDRKKLKLSEKVVITSRYFNNMIGQEISPDILEKILPQIEVFLKKEYYQYLAIDEKGEIIIEKADKNTIKSSNGTSALEKAVKKLKEEIVDQYIQNNFAAIKLARQNYEEKTHREIREQRPAARVVEESGDINIEEEEEEKKKEEEKENENERKRITEYKKTRQAIAKELLGRQREAAIKAEKKKREEQEEIARKAEEERKKQEEIERKAKEEAAALKREKAAKENEAREAEMARLAELEKQKQISEAQEAARKTEAERRKLEMEAEVVEISNFLAGERIIKRWQDLPQAAQNLLAKLLRNENIVNIKICGRAVYQPYNPNITPRTLDFAITTKHQLTTEELAQLCQSFTSPQITEEENLCKISDYYGFNFQIYSQDKEPANWVCSKETEILLTRASIKSGLRKTQPIKTKKGEIVFNMQANNLGSYLAYLCAIGVLEIEDLKGRFTTENAAIQAELKLQRIEDIVTESVVRYGLGVDCELKFLNAFLTIASQVENFRIHTESQKPFVRNKIYLKKPYNDFMVLYNNPWKERAAIEPEAPNAAKATGTALREERPKGPTLGERRRFRKKEFEEKVVAAQQKYDNKLSPTEESYHEMNLSTLLQVAESCRNKDEQEKIFLCALDRAIAEESIEIVEQCLHSLKGGKTALRKTIDFYSELSEKQSAKYAAALALGHISKYLKQNTHSEDELTKYFLPQIQKLFLPAFENEHFRKDFSLQKYFIDSKDKTSDKKGMRAILHNRLITNGISVLLTPENIDPILERNAHREQEILQFTVKVANDLNSRLESGYKIDTAPFTEKLGQPEMLEPAVKLAVPNSLPPVMPSESAASNSLPDVIPSKSSSAKTITPFGVPRSVLQRQARLAAEEAIKKDENPLTKADLGKEIDNRLRNLSQSKLDISKELAGIIFNQDAEISAKKEDLKQILQKLRAIKNYNIAQLKTISIKNKIDSDKAIDLNKALSDLEAITVIAEPSRAFDAQQDQPFSKMPYNLTTDEWIGQINEIKNQQQELFGQFKFLENFCNSSDNIGSDLRNIAGQIAAIDNALAIIPQLQNSYNQEEEINFYLQLSLQAELPIEQVDDVENISAQTFADKINDRRFSEIPLGLLAQFKEYVEAMFRGENMPQFQENQDLFMASFQAVNRAAYDGMAQFLSAEQVPSHVINPHDSQKLEANEAVASRF